MECQVEIVQKKVRTHVFIQYAVKPLPSGHTITHNSKNRFIIPRRDDSQE
jgi:hypothetical protein